MFPFTRVPFWVHIFDPQPFGHRLLRSLSLSLSAFRGEEHQTTAQQVAFGRSGGKSRSGPRRHGEEVLKGNYASMEVHRPL